MNLYIGKSRSFKMHRHTHACGDFVDYIQVLVGLV